MMLFFIEHRKVKSLSNLSPIHVFSASSIILDSILTKHSPRNHTDLIIATIWIHLDKLDLWLFCSATTIVQAIFYLLSNCYFSTQPYQKPSSLHSSMHWQSTRLRSERKRIQSDKWFLALIGSMGEVDLIKQILEQWDRATMMLIVVTIIVIIKFPTNEYYLTILLYF